jgi:tetratricopeptide (TPR) repeat protein
VVRRGDEAGSATALGTRVRELRRAAGLTQDQLAAGRFTKQYVSQIERGEVVPSGELLGWLADRLGVERDLLETGVAAADLARIERSLAEGHRLLDEHRYGEALELFGALRPSLPPGAPRSVLRDAVRGETWALIRLGLVTEAAEVLGAAGQSAGTGEETRDEQAEIAYLTAVCCYSISEIPAAQVEFARALRLLDEAEEPNDRLRLDIHQWRSRCYRRERDWEAAREDIDLALELCDAIGDARRTAEVNLQASLVAERQGRWVLARRYAEESRDGFCAVGDTVTMARVLNNLGGLNHSLGSDDVAVAQLREALGVFVQAGLDAEAGYVLSSLAEIHRERGELGEAEHAARQAVDLLQGRVDHVQEIGTAQLVLARSHLERGRLEEAEETLAAVDRSYGQTGSVSHLARSWMTRGELELERRNDAEAARLYREAATALQPVDPATDY